MIRDTQGRFLRNLRVSVTDRCNLRCAYCMPEEEYVWLPREEILHFEEIDRLVDVFITLGATYLFLDRPEQAADLYERCLDELAKAESTDTSARVRFAIPWLNGSSAFKMTAPL